MDLSAIPVIDHHCHGLRRGHPADAAAFRAAFTESADPRQIAEHVPQSAYYRWLLRQVAAALGCGGSEAEVLAARAAWPSPAALARHLWPRARIAEMLLDTGFLPAEMLPPHEMAAATGVPAREVVRLEALAEELIAASATFDQLREAWRAAVGSLRDRGAVAAKTIAAYRTGLDVRPVAQADAEAAFLPLGGRRVRLDAKPLLDFLLWEAFPLLAAAGLPLQVHVGYGDADADQRLADPLHLRAVLQREELRGMPVVLLHCYPYVRQAGVLAATYAHVAMDCSLIIPLGLTGAARYLAEALEIAPASKLLYASDAHSWPEGHWLGAVVYRRALGETLEAAVHAGYLSAAEAEADAEAVLAGNARRLYGLA